MNDKVSEHARMCLTDTISQYKFFINISSQRRYVWSMLQEMTGHDRQKSFAMQEGVRYVILAFVLEILRNYLMRLA